MSILRPKLSLREALDNPALLGGPDGMGGDSWSVWRLILCAALGEKLSSDERSQWHNLTGGCPYTPGARLDELWIVAGRRGGKTRAMAALGVYLSALCSWDHVLGGERGKLLLLGGTQTQADSALTYAESFITRSPMLRQMMERSTAFEISLSNRVDLSIRAANHRTVRGSTAIGAIVDEIAYMENRELSANPDRAILEAVRPSLLTTQGLLLCISSPRGRRGALWDAYRDHYGSGRDPGIRVVQASTKELNPVAPLDVIERAFQRDPKAALAEYGARFRDDLEGFLSLDDLLGVTSQGISQRRWERGVEYWAFCDMSGGRRDSAALAIAHPEREIAVLDLVREVRAPFSPAKVADEFCRVLRDWQIGSVTGDRYGADILQELFRSQGIRYRESKISRSEIYLNFLPLATSGVVDLLDDEELREQIAGLERRVTRGRQDVVDHPPGCRDDLANAACGAVVLCAPVNIDEPTLIIGSYSFAPSPTGSGERQSMTFSGLDYLRGRKARTW